MLLLLACASAPVGPPCLPITPIDADLAIRVWRGQGVPAAPTERLEAWWAAEGLRLRISAEGERAIGDALGPADGVTSEARRAAVIAPLRALLAPADGTVHLLVVARVAAPDSPMLHLLPELDGLALTPLSPADDPIRALFPLDGVAPLVVVAQDAGTEVVAHELGHALGLGHDADPRSVMAATRARGCRPTLTTAQRAQLKDALAVLGR